mmetsp:Transcript_88364/g.153049  ORF Transcript_88364/g.153049 Transcript_88364/m.153049 type:complete len:219 (+) Transcript_88364:503-1159(+)
MAALASKIKASLTPGGHAGNVSPLVDQQLNATNIARTASKVQWAEPLCVWHYTLRRTHDEMLKDLSLHSVTAALPQQSEVDWRIKLGIHKVHVSSEKTQNLHKFWQLVLTRKMQRALSGHRLQVDHGSILQQNVRNTSKIALSQANVMQWCCANVIDCIHVGTVFQETLHGGNLILGSLDCNVQRCIALDVCLVNRGACLKLLLDTRSVTLAAERYDH